MRVSSCADAARPRALALQRGANNMLALRALSRSCVRARVARCALVARPQRVAIGSHDASGKASRGAAPAASAAESQADTAGAAPGGQYPFKEVEERWQRHWEDNATFRTPTKVDTSKPKFYALDMFPYPRRGTPAAVVREAARVADSQRRRRVQRRGLARGPPGGLHRH